MSRFQAGLIGFAVALVTGAGLALCYTALALLNDWPTASGILQHANAAQGALLGLAAGLALGFLAGHWWPTQGRGKSC